MAQAQEALSGPRETVRTYGLTAMVRSELEKFLTDQFINPECDGERPWKERNILRKGMIEDTIKTIVRNVILNFGTEEERENHGF